MKNASFLRAVLRALPLVITAALTLPTGCSHETESPTVGGSTVAPDVVCNQQVKSTVKINGSGFTPEPNKVLEDKPILILPSIKLTEKKLLDCSALTDPAHVIDLPGDPRKPNAGAVGWQSQSVMTLNIDGTANPVVPNFTDAGGKVPMWQGYYDVTVTNPDGTHKATISPGLAVMDPPHIITVTPNTICFDQGPAFVELQGTNFLKLGDKLPEVTITSKTEPNVTKTYTPTLAQCAAVCDTSPPAELCTSATIEIHEGPGGDPTNELPVGDYTITLTNPPTGSETGCHTEDTFSVSVQGSPKVDLVTPTTICMGGSEVVADGANIIDGATMCILCGAAANDADLTKCTMSSSTVVMDAAGNPVAAGGTGTKIRGTFGVLPPSVIAGDTCQVLVINPAGCRDRPLPHKTITVIEGPILFFVDPPVAYNGINTKITLYVTSLQPPPTVSIVLSGSGDTPTPLVGSIVTGTTNRIQATVPKGTPAGDYDVIVTDQSGCRATLPKGLKVVDQVTLTLNAIDPPFGLSTESVPVQITGAGFLATPRAFISFPDPGAADPAVQLQGISLPDATGAKLNAVVPAGVPPGGYMLVVVNPDGAVGVLPAPDPTTGQLPTTCTNTSCAYNSIGTAPPVISDISPQSITTNGGTVTVTGTGFVSGATGILTCHDVSGATIASPSITSVTCTPTSCTVVIGGSATAGATCVLRVTNPDGSYGDFSALGITTPALNLSNPAAGAVLNVGRRALYSGAVRANSVARFVYAVGGDDGTTTTFNSVEFATVDLFGKMSPWTMNHTSMMTARSFLAGATIGRYIYAIGGSDGAGALASAERALVLSPSEVPTVADVDLCLSGGAPCFGIAGLADGLEPGAYSYRVSALIDPADPVNLGGETLASDPFIIKLPTIQSRQISVKLTWGPPKDSLGATLSGITGYRIYRTPKDGVPGQDEVLLTEVQGVATTTYVDDDSKPLGTEKPLPAGSTSAWQAIPNLNAARKAAAGAAAKDPSDTTGATWHIYALLGEGLASYEYLTVNVLPNARQTVGGAWTNGSSNSAVARSELGAWVADSVTSPLVTAPDVFIYIGSGRTGQFTGDRTVEAAKVAAGGDLGAWDNTPSDFNGVRYGYGVAAANGELFAFGGNGPDSNAIAAKEASPMPALAPNSWNNEGLQMTSARYLPGSSIQSAFIFLIGGQATPGGAALNSTETVAW